ncbi:MAG: nicotinate-nucleotide adenylyltransferase [Nitrospinota bacterium]|nr:nicotinate-nucleotide adenylyltransferase [Nitrospinota bacterium]
MKIGLIGGMFDPPHIGHLSCAQQAVQRFGLEKVFFVPSLVPPHKTEIHASAEERYEMLKIATRGNPLFEVSRTEIDRRGTEASYSIDTIREFRERTGGDLYFIIGTDAFSEIHTWRSAGELFQLCNFIVTGRPGWDTKTVVDKAATDLARFGVGIVREEGAYSADADVYLIAETGYRIFFYSTLLLDVSSTIIREILSAGGSIKYIVPEDVEQFIIDKGIYIKAGK